MGTLESDDGLRRTTTYDEGTQRRIVRYGRLILTAMYRDGDLFELRVQINPDGPHPDLPIRQSELASLPLQAMQRSVVFSREVDTIVVTPDVRRFKVTRPDRTDDWRRRFAEIYQDAAVTTSAPARLIAQASGVPVSAVHRWAHEARLRGFLPGERENGKK